MDFWDKLRYSWLAASGGFGLICILTIIFYFKVWTRPSPWRNRMIRFTILIYTVLATFFCLELLFGFGIKQTDGFGNTYSSRLWDKKYWNPINSLGYRDTDEKHFEGRQVLYVVGDSFVTGPGVKDVKDRFADVLGRQLGDGWEYAIVAQSGWQTDEEVRGARAYPAKPNLIVLSYFINDIHTAAVKCGFHFTPASDIVEAKINPIFEKSFFLNWVYWRNYRGQRISEYWEYLKTCYTREDIMQTHEQELQAAIDYAQEVHATICLAAWPHLVAIPESRKFTSRVIDYFHAQDLLTIDLADLFENEPASELTINSMDAHPSVKSHHRAGLEIYNRLKKAGVVE